MVTSELKEFIKLINTITFDNKFELCQRLFKNKDTNVSLQTKFNEM